MSEPAHPEATATERGRSLRWGVRLIAAAGALSILSGLSTLVRSLTDGGFETGVATLGGVTSEQLARTNPAVLDYITHLHLNVAGLAIALGIGTLALAIFGIRDGQRWALWTAIALPAVFLAHTIPVHLTAGFSFHALTHLGPIAIVVALLITGAVLAHRGLDSEGDLA